MSARYLHRRFGAAASARGAAVVLAMLLAALAATVAATLFADQQRWFRTVEYRRDQVQAQAIAMAGVQWARQILNDDARSTTIDHLGEPWALTLPTIPLENGAVRGSIADAQARLNVNGLGAIGPAFDIERGRIARLFAQHGGPASAIDAIADWVDADSVTRQNGAEDAFYASRPISGLAANVPVARIAEVGAVRGMTLPALAAVLPFLTALPIGAQVNVNTAAPEVLAAIVENLEADALGALVAARKAKPFTTIADFRARLPEGAVVTGTESLSVKSDYFYVNVEAQQGAPIARSRALVHRTSDGAWPAIVWQIVE